MKLFNCQREEATDPLPVKGLFEGLIGIYRLERQLLLSELEVKSQRLRLGSNGALRGNELIDLLSKKRPEANPGGIVPIEEVGSHHPRKERERDRFRVVF